MGLFAHPSATGAIEFHPLGNGLRLAPRLEEIAAIVWQSSGVTAQDVQAALTTPLSNGAIRTMLGRLIKKGVIRRHSAGRYRTFVYYPAVAMSELRDQALKKLATEYFEGSLTRVAAATIELIQAEAGESAGSE